MQCADTFKKESVTELFRAKRAAPVSSSVKQYLAASNTYPAGLIASVIAGAIRPQPLSELNDREWRIAITENSWALVTILLRVGQTGSNSSFLMLFVDIESDYKAAVKKSNWLSYNSKTPADHVVSLAIGLDEKFSELESKFIEWAISNRTIVQTEIERLTEDSSLSQGNALMDLERWNPIWFEIEQNTQTLLC